MSNTVDVKNEVKLNKKTERSENIFQFNKPITFLCSNDHKEIDRLIKISTDNLPSVVIKEYREIGEVDFNNKSNIGHYNDLLTFLDSAESDALENTVIIILRNITSQLKDKKVLSKIELISEKTNYNAKFNFYTIIISNNNTVENEIDYLTSIIDIKKPDLNGINSYVYNYINQYSIEYKKDDIEELCFALLGLTYIQIHQILNRFKTSGVISSFSKQIIIQEKSEIIKKSGILELITFKESINDIGGLDTLKGWLKNKAEIFSRLEEAIEFGVDIPKGLLLMGMPGCGKSLSAKAAARLFNLPLLRLDIGRLLGKYVGESEENFRKALELAESISPVILWVDEIEKAFSGIDQSGGASDITKRLFGHFLTWLQEKENTVFVVATANDISSFPPEFLRKGRFDEIFYIDFPSPEEREDIFRIHLEKRGVKNSDIDFKKLSIKTNNFSGADIESVVKEANEISFLQKEELSETTLLDVIKQTTPLYEVLNDKIQKLKDTLGKYKIKSASNNEVVKSNKDLVYVQGNKYKPSFYTEFLTVESFYISKYSVTQDIYEELMQENPSHFKGLKRPVESITWIQALKFCNKMSENENLRPVYQIKDSKLFSIVYKDGQTENPSCADFSKTEGYRLPTEVEWEWAAIGGIPAIQNKTNGTDYSGSDDINDVARYANDYNQDKRKYKSGGIIALLDKTLKDYQNCIDCNHETYNVGGMKKNELGLYDLCGNIWELTFDTRDYDEKFDMDAYGLLGIGSKIKEVKYINTNYHHNLLDEYIIIKGGSICNDYSACKIASKPILYPKNEISRIVGFRICKSK